MFQTIVLNGVTIKYLIKRSRRSRHLRISINPQHGLVVTLSWRMSDHHIEPFLQEKADWIIKHLKKAKIQNKKKIPVSHQDYQKNKTHALEVLIERVVFFNQFYRYNYSKISIRNQKTIWGSCTRTGNLQFNFKLLYLPKRTIDYVVVHELCHLKEHNHGVSFWQSVAKIFPDYKQLRKSMRGYIM